MLDEINHGKHTHDRVNQKTLIGIIEDVMSEDLEVVKYGQKQCSLKREYIISTKKCKVSPSELHLRIQRGSFVRSDKIINSNQIINKIVSHIQTNKSMIPYAGRLKRKRKVKEKKSPTTPVHA